MLLHNFILDNRPSFDYTYLMRKISNENVNRTKNIERALEVNP